MLEAPFDFDDIMAPIGADAFLADYEGKKPLHLKGAADKFAKVMSWSLLNDLLGQAPIWSQASLMLVLDKEPVQAQAYCQPMAGRDGGQVMRPDPRQGPGISAEGGHPGCERHRPSERRTDRFLENDGAGAWRKNPG